MHLIYHVLFRREIPNRGGRKHHLIYQISSLLPRTKWDEALKIHTNTRSVVLVVQVYPVFRLS